VRLRLHTARARGWRRGPAALARYPAATSLSPHRRPTRLSGFGSAAPCTVLIEGPMGQLSCHLLDRARRLSRPSHHRGLRPGDELTPIQRAFLPSTAASRAASAPGQIMAAHALAGENSSHADRGRDQRWIWSTSAAAPATIRSSSRSSAPRRGGPRSNSCPFELHTPTTLNEAV